MQQSQDKLVFYPKLFFEELEIDLELNLYPDFVITGTFFHSASNVVVTPVNGKVSRHKSILS